MGKKKMRKAIKRVSKDLEEAREETRELIEGLAERISEALEHQAETNRALTETLEAYSKSLHAPEAGESGAEVTSDVDQSEAAEKQRDEEPPEVEVTEAAERKAHELAVDLDGVKGTGSGGRVLVKDVEEAAG